MAIFTGEVIRLDSTGATEIVSLEIHDDDDYAQSGETGAEWIVDGVSLGPDAPLLEYVDIDVDLVDGTSTTWTTVVRFTDGTDVFYSRPYFEDPNQVDAVTSEAPRVLAPPFFKYIDHGFLAEGAVSYGGMAYRVIYDTASGLVFDEFAHDVYTVDDDHLIEFLAETDVAPDGHSFGALDLITHRTDAGSGDTVMVLVDVDYQTATGVGTFTALKTTTLTPVHQHVVYMPETGAAVDLDDITAFLGETVLGTSVEGDAWTDYSLHTTPFSRFFFSTGDDDRLGRLGNDLFDGMEGNDSFYGHGGADHLIGGLGLDMLFGGIGNDTLEGGEDDDLLRGGPGDDSLDGGLQNDTLDGQDGDDTIIGGKGADRIDGGAGADDILGSKGSDTAFGGPGDDTIDGEEGDDSLGGNLGNDDILGGDGQDALSGGSGHDTLDGGLGFDSLYGGSGKDSLIGGDEADLIEAGSGRDVADGGDGDDTLLGENGHDNLSGSTGQDVLEGGAGRDTLNAGRDDDTLDGGAGEDSLSGGKGDDLLIGGDDADTLNGGLGEDTLEGGAGADVFVFEVDSSTDHLIDFENGVDLIDLDVAFGVLTFTDIAPGEVHITHVFETIIVTDTAGLLTSADFDAGDFI